MPGFARDSVTELLVRVPLRPPLAVLMVCVGAAAATLPLFAGGAPASGRIAGIVHLVAPGGPPLRSGAYATRGINGATPDAAEISNVVVFVRDAPPDPTLPVMRTAIAQRGESFVPRVTAITRASTVEFPNFDPYFHNVFSLSRGATFDLGRFRQGARRERTFTRAGVVKVFCHIHSEMAATIRVFDHGLFTVPRTNGAFAIEAVPPGTYDLSAWHERIGGTSQTVEIKAGETTRVEFSLPVVDR